eukprot:SAG11_NODE_822_length_7009_cov_7.776122_4_plen_48_part_00
MKACWQVFIDEGDVDMVECLRVYKEIGYDGVMMPDHTPFGAPLWCTG